MGIKKVILFFSLIAILPSCVEDSPGLEQYYDNRDEGIAFLNEKKNEEGVLATESGLLYEVVSEGDGELTMEYDVVKFRYTVSSTDGVTYFSNENLDLESVPYTALNLFQEPYLREGISLMNVGSSIRLYVPFELGYGVFTYGEILPFSALVVDLELLENFFPDNAQNPDVHVTESGLQYEVLAEGTGENANEDSDVKVHYHGTFLNGEVFDSSVDRDTPSEFNLGGVIEGFSEGVQLMNTGAKYRFYMPYDLAYGAQGTNGIPGYTPLIFEVELLEIQ